MHPDHFEEAGGIAEITGLCKIMHQNNRDYGTNRDKADLKTCVSL